jgi:hypothetical protein
VYAALKKPSMSVGAANGRRGSGLLEFNYPMGIASGKHGNILIVDHGNGRIQVRHASRRRLAP